MSWSYGINYIMLDETNINQLISNIETPAFGYEKKLIIARNSKLFKKEGNANGLRDRINEYIKENIDLIKESVTLVFVEEEVDSRLSLFKTINKYGKVMKFDFEKPAQICERLKKIAKAYGVSVDNATLMYFVESCGTNMQELINEIRKLIEYAGKGRVDF